MLNLASLFGASAPIAPREVAARSNCSPIPADHLCASPKSRCRYVAEVQRDGMSEAWRQTIVAFFLELSERFEAGKRHTVPYCVRLRPPPVPYV